MRSPKQLSLLLAIFAVTGCHAQPVSLCVDGHPAKREAHVTYAGLPARPGYQRDHRIPLCLGGADSADNVWYQPLSDAYRKDAAERRACELFCAGAIGLEAAREMVARY